MVMANEFRKEKQTKRNEYDLVKQEHLEMFCV
jgi:hypothetical protein